MSVSSEPISIYALGGLGEVGKNTYCFESENSIIIIDAGVRFPEADLPGVSYVIPDYSRLKNNRQKVKALFITHGHEDHIGGIPFLIQHLFIPVIYAPRLAAALIRRKLTDMRIHEEVNIVEYDGDSEINVDIFKVSFFHVTHSIPDAYGIVVDTPSGRIVHTGDFKIDLTPVGQEISLTRIAQIGQEGVDLLLSDSTNAEIEGYTPSESNVLSAIEEVFNISQGRIILSTFSSNISRIQQVIQVAVEHGRYVCIIGRSMENAVNISRDFGYIKIPDNRIIPEESLSLHKASELCILCTGSQGETMAALNKIARDEHKYVRIIPGDTVIFSSSAIPGNGVFIERIVNQLVRKGAEVWQNSTVSNVHSSGHPSKQELRIMLKLVNPTYFMPIHGEHRMLKIHGQIAESLGIDKNKIFILDNGQTIILNKHKVTQGISFPCDPVYLDGKNNTGTNTSIIQDRETLKSNGLVIVSLALNSKINTIVSAPKVYFKGVIGTIKEEFVLGIINEMLDRLLPTKPTFGEIKNEIKSVVGKYIYRRTECSPMIVPVIIDQTKC